MNISGVGSSSSLWPTNRSEVSSPVTREKPVSTLSDPGDEVSFSPVARLMAELQSIPEDDPSRQGLIERLREEIERGTYESDEKLDIAIAKFLKEFQSDDRPS